MSKKTESERFCSIVIASSIIFLCFLVVYFSSAGNAIAQDMFIYPEKGQSAEQQEKDKFECYTWARNQTGFDPMQTPTATTPPPQQQAQVGGVGRGAVRGGAVGLGVGAIAGDAGKGAAAGAVAGGLIGGARRQDQRRQQAQAEQQWADQQASQYANNRNNYNRAYAACLEGRGYTVK